MQKQKTAAMIIIGNEILSGRTQDKNLNYIAKKLASMGIIFAEARVVRDIEEDIVKTVNELRAKYDYIFTTGGIGPTHDDITSECISAAFGVKWVVHEEARQRLEEYYKNRGAELNDARLRMAKTPEGAELIDNPITSAPGYRIGNVFVLAGIPSIMQVMFDYASEQLDGGMPIVSETVSCDLVEGDIAADLEAIQKQFTGTDIGSYPFIYQGKYAAAFVIRSVDEKLVEGAKLAIENMVRTHKGNFIRQE
jgi:molybdenum cofactor synthesis domain-containing protein